MIQQRLNALIVHDLLCAVNLGLEHEAFGIYEQVTFSASYLLAAQFVAAFFSTYYPSRFDRLAIHYPGAGLRVPLEADPHPLAYGCMHPCPCSPSKRNCLKK